MAPWTFYILFWTLLLTYLLGSWRLHWANKDGGPESKVRMWGFECKALGSILLLRFDYGTREAHHSHAFGSINWLLKGWLAEQVFSGPRIYHEASVVPIVTRRSMVHKVRGLCDTNWVLALRGPWQDTWCEVVDNKLVRLTHGRKVVAL